MKSSIDKQASSDTCCWAAEAAQVAVAGTLCFLVEGMRLVASSLALSIERESCGGGSSMSCPVCSAWSAWAVICCPLSLAKNKERCQKVDDTSLHSTAGRAFGQLRLQLLELVPFPDQPRPVQARDGDSDGTWPKGAQTWLIA